VGRRRVRLKTDEERKGQGAMDLSLLAALFGCMQAANHMAKRHTTRHFLKQPIYVDLFTSLQLFNENLYNTTSYPCIGTYDGQPGQLTLLAKIGTDRLEEK
jgi:hypothetical protein